MLHKIKGSEVHASAGLLPGYAAIRLSLPRPWRPRLRHFAMVFAAGLVALVAAGTRGLLP